MSMLKPPKYQPSARRSALRGALSETLWCAWPESNRLSFPKHNVLGYPLPYSTSPSGLSVPLEPASATSLRFTVLFPLKLQARV